MSEKRMKTTDSIIQCQLKLKLRPAQERQLVRWLYHLTGVWNWTVRKIELEAAHGVYLTRFDLHKLLKGHSQRMGIAYYALEGIADQAHQAWKRCFWKVSRRPRLKGMRNRLSSIPFGHGPGKLTARTVNVPCIGAVKYHKQVIPAGHICSSRIVRRASGWYMCLLIRADPAPIRSIADGQVGIDPGFSTLITTSTGETVEHPKELAAGADRLAKAQRGSKRRLAARLLERQGNRRKDRNHKLSRRLVAENRLIAWSKDRSANLARVFGKSVTSAGHQQLRRHLAYKSRTGGREFIEVASRNSTRTCSACRALTGPTGFAGLSVRQWTCRACGAHHERDINAARNTLLAGLGMSHERGRETATGIVT